MEQAQKIVDAVELLRQEMSDISQLRKGKVVVGSMPITGSHLLPHVLPAFQQAYPDIEVTLLEDSGITLEKLTASGKADLSLLSLPLQEPSLSYVKIGKNALIWLYRQTIPWLIGELRASCSLYGLMSFGMNPLLY